VSEGLDFANQNGRAVVITGIPYPNLTEPKIKEKRKYLDKKISFHNSNLLSGSDWYRLCASRAVNQAVGRVIRHRWDYGAIILADERFTRCKQDLSLWLRPRVQVFDEFGPSIHSIVQFFKNLKEFVPPTEIKAINIINETETNNSNRPSLFVRYKNTIPKKQTIKQEEEKEPDSKIYKEEICKKLSNEDFNQFKCIMKDYQEKKDFEALIEGLIKLLGSEEKFKLLEDFRCLLKGKNKEIFIERINALRSTPTRPIENKDPHKNLLKRKKNRNSKKFK